MQNNNITGKTIFVTYLLVVKFLLQTTLSLCKQEGKYRLVF